MAEIIHCTRQEYDDYPALRSSDLKVFMESPLKYQDVVLNGNYKKEPTDSMRMGTMLHQFLLESKSVEGLHYLKWTGATRSGSKWEMFKDDCDSRDLPYVICNSKKNELELIAAQVKAIQKCKKAMEIIEATAVREQAIAWEQQGVKCKALLDMLCGDGPIADLKTAADTSEKGFFWSLDDYGYHISAAFYEMARNALWKSEKVYPFYWIVVANSGWIHCKVYELQDELRDIARFQINSKLEHLRHCQETNDWTDHELNKSHVLHATNYYLEKNGLGLISG